MKLRLKRVLTLKVFLTQALLDTTFSQWGAKASCLVLWVAWIIQKPGFSTNTHFSLCNAVSDVYSVRQKHNLVLFSFINLYFPGLAWSDVEESLGKLEDGSHEWGSFLRMDPLSKLNSKLIKVILESCWGCFAPASETFHCICKPPVTTTSACLATHWH
jgi:hypothetical protein